MKNKQKAVSKILVTTLFLFCALNVSAQVTEILAKADSLFAAKQYTQSNELYQEILIHHKYSNAMLLKMAFIQEGLGRLSESLYYLNLYYLASNDKQALLKMDEVAKKNRLIGYESSQTRLFYSFLRKNSYMILSVLFSLSVFSLH